jgi:hypothetical protein
MGCVPIQAELHKLGSSIHLRRNGRSDLEMLWVLEHTVAIYPDLQRLLEEIVKGDCFLASDFPQPAAIEREAPQVLGQRQARDTKQEVMNFGAED